MDIFFLFVPRRTFECDELLERQGLLDEEKISTLNMYMVPLEDDLFSLELPDNFMHHMLKDDDDHKVYSEEVIKRLELAYGEIDYKFAIGSIS